MDRKKLWDNHRASAEVARKGGVLRKRFVTSEPITYLHNYNSLKKSQEKLMKLSYPTGGNKIIIEEAHPWVVLVATPVMMRAQKLSTAAEIIFVDTTSTVDMTSSNVTLVLTATKVGAIPLCILIHESQTKECYTKAFSIVKHTFPYGFGGKEVMMKGKNPRR